MCSCNFAVRCYFFASQLSAANPIFRLTCRSSDLARLASPLIDWHCSWCLWCLLPLWFCLDSPHRCGWRFGCAATASSAKVADIRQELPTRSASERWTRHLLTALGSTIEAVWGLVCASRLAAAQSCPFRSNRGSAGGRCWCCWRHSSHRYRRYTHRTRRLRNLL